MRSHVKCVVKNTFLEISDVQSQGKEGSAKKRSLSEDGMCLKRETDFDSEQLCLKAALMSIDSPPSTAIFPSNMSDDDAERSISKDFSTTASSFSDCCTAELHGNYIIPPEFTAAELRESMGNYIMPAEFTAEELSSETPRGEYMGSPKARPSWYDQTQDEFENETWRPPACWHNQTVNGQAQVPSQAIEATQKLAGIVAEEHLKFEDLMTNELALQLFPFIPYDDQDNLTSLGSILHAEGICKPCSFLTKGRCHKKHLCMFCHFDHQSTKQKPSYRRMMNQRLNIRENRKRSTHAGGALDSGEDLSSLEDKVGLVNLSNDPARQGYSVHVVQPGGLPVRVGQHHHSALQPSDPTRIGTPSIPPQTVTWNQSEKQTKVQNVRTEMLDKLQELSDLVAKESLTREDLMTNELTVQLSPFIPFDDQGSMTSLGSILHIEGTCKPCSFLKKDRCHKKELCVYCHFDHEDEKQKNAYPRKLKDWRVRLARKRRDQKLPDIGVRVSL